jgi:hypothetical protein
MSGVQPETKTKTARTPALPMRDPDWGGLGWLINLVRKLHKQASPPERTT